MESVNTGGKGGADHLQYEKVQRIPMAWVQTNLGATLAKQAGIVNREGEITAKGR